MSITSLNFFYLLLAVLVIYFLLPRRAQNYWLLLVSYAFTVSWAWQFGLLLLVITTANYFLGRQIPKTEIGQKRLLWLGIILNVVLLIFFRTANFYLSDLLSLFASLGIRLSGQSIQILVPIGLAYYSLQSISYLVDVYRKQTPASNDFIDFALYLAYFPKLLAGPIESARTFLPKLAQPRLVDNAVIARSIVLIVEGLIRKLFIASILSAIIFWDAFENPAQYTGPELVSWLILYGFYLYNDFAGYTSIARGVSGLFGIELSYNFKQPYFARNFTEFWNSWHISLSHWLRDYIYFPVGRALLRRFPSRLNVINLVVPPLVTMLVSGLWHGLSWNTVLWGGVHGFYLVIERLASLRGPVVSPQKWPLWRQGFAMGFVFLLVSIAWAPFIMDLPVALSYWRGLFDWTYPIIRYRRILLFIPLFAVTIAVDWLQRHYQDEAFFLRWPRLVQAPLLAASMILLALLMQSAQAEPFVYQGF
jgi:D-alanyl-lipoteichoic acid acyltransferase DltB (MBOAT superfamily)